MTRGLTLHEYVKAKRLDLPFLVELGVRDAEYAGNTAVEIPYHDETGAVAAVRYRVSLDGNPRFRWRKGDEQRLYRHNAFSAATPADYCVITEGESDCHTMWQHGTQAIGVPGNHWKPEWDQQAPDLPVFYAVCEPGKGGEEFIKSLSASKLAPKVQVVFFDPHKDPSALYLSDPANFRRNFQTALRNACTLDEVPARQLERKERELFSGCEPLAASKNILEEFTKSARQRGLVGEDRNAKILYLSTTSRLNARPVSVVVKGPSSGGKSCLVDTVLSHFPSEAYIFRTGFSDHALVYTDENLSHRMLVIAEASGAEGEKQSYYTRSLLSEGRLTYETVESTDEGIKAKTIKKEGPTGLILTTTKPALHPENETRVLSVLVKDTPAQTRAVLLAIAAGQDTGPPDEIWLKYQSWLELGERRVDVPYAKILAGLVADGATRIRRDFRQLIVLIQTNALLHRHTRDRDTAGRIVATLEDYKTVHGLIADVMAEGVASAVPPTVRQAVQAVVNLFAGAGVTVNAVAEKLHIDKSAASRRCATAVELGYLVDRGKGPGHPKVLEPGSPLPEDQPVLPAPDQLASAIDTECPPLPPNNRATDQPLEPSKANGCTVARLREGGGGQGQPDRQLQDSNDAGSDDSGWSATI